MGMRNVSSSICDASKMKSRPVASMSSYRPHIMDPLRPIQVTKRGRTKPSCSSRVRTGYIASCMASRQSVILWFSSEATPDYGVGSDHHKWLRDQELLLVVSLDSVYERATI